MSKRQSQAYDLSYDELRAMGFYYVDYDVSTNTWDIRRKWRKNNSRKEIEKNIKITITNDDQHPYGVIRHAPIISFSCGDRKYSISFPRFIYAYKKGFISKDKQLRRRKDAPEGCLDWWCWEERDIKDHDDYEKSNAVMALRKKIEDLEAQYEASRFKF